MKKGITILLILALVAGSVFAGKLTGAAQIDFGYNFKTTDWGFDNSKTNSKYSFEFKLDTSKVEIKDHNTEVWAELEVSASSKIEKKADKTTVGFATPSVSMKAYIHVNDWTFGILEAGESKQFASSYFKTGTAVENTIKSVKNVAPGFSVSYKGWNGGIGAAGDIDDKINNIYVHGATPEFKFAEDSITAQGAGYIVYANDSHAAAAAKVGYKAENLTANVAADVKHDNAEIIYEVAANAAFKKDLVIVDVYATPGKYLSAGAGKAFYAGSYADAMSLNAKVASAYTFDFDGTAVVVNGSVDARNILIDKREITVAADETVTLGAVKIEASESYAIFGKVLKASVKATHTADKFVAYAKVSTEVTFAATTTVKVPFEYKISSKAIVENAELSLLYTGADFADFSAAPGAVTASAKIAF